MVVHRQRERRGRASVAVSAGEPPVARLRMPLEWLGIPHEASAWALVASRPGFAVLACRRSDRHLRASAVFAQLSRALAAANLRRRSPPWQVPGRPSEVGSSVPCELVPDSGCVCVYGSKDRLSRERPTPRMRLDPSEVVVGKRDHPSDQGIVRCRWDKGTREERRGPVRSACTS